MLLLHIHMHDQMFFAFHIWFAQQYLLFPEIMLLYYCESGNFF